MAVPIVDAMTALRSCALCSVSVSPDAVVAMAMALLPVNFPWSAFFPVRSLSDDTSGSGQVAIDAWPQRSAAAKDLYAAIDAENYSPGLLDAAITVTGISR